MLEIKQLAAKVKQASHALASLSSDAKNALLNDIASHLRAEHSTILSVNQKEVEKALNQSMQTAFVDRLRLTEQRIEDMAQGVEVVAQLPDPVGQSRELGIRSNGIAIAKRRIPLGVVCMIYEARPNVTADAGALCLKSGNAVILRGGREALQTSLCIAQCLQTVIRDHGLHRDILTVVPDADRHYLNELLQQKDSIDLVIPRGGEGLINYVSENSRIPVIQHYKGVCHLYVDQMADCEMALALFENGKVQRPGVCNALECLLVHKEAASKLLPKIAMLCEERGVTIHAHSSAKSYFPSSSELLGDEFGIEYLSLDVAIRVVDTFDQALEHIREYGSHHTEVICTDIKENAEKFVSSVDAAVVMVNASSRFSDGSQLGLGAEIGIATSKLHAYGPMGLEALTTEKFVVHGKGQVRT